MITVLKKLLGKSNYGRLKEMFHSARLKSIQKALSYQDLAVLFKKLASSGIDITNQYTQFEVKDRFRELKTRALHTFQVSIILKALKLLKDESEPLIVDIGDSSGAHILYLKSILGKIKSLSINLDPVAVEKIRSRGLEAICKRAEELESEDIHTDVFLCFETLEHLTDPSRFLHTLSSSSDCKSLVITVPYVRSSRMGLHTLRKSQKVDIFAENTHIFELSPEDWKLLFMFSGWKVKYEQIYLQYPEKGMYSAFKRYWAKHDFEGFYGVVLERDDTWSSLYKDW